jgi:STAM-binding protein
VPATIRYTHAKRSRVSLVNQHRFISVVTGPRFGCSTPSAQRTQSSSNPTDPVTRELKSVNLPRECSPIPQHRSRQHGSKQDKERKFVVTTLLIPKQYSPSDTCTMDEEALVLKFTEERSMITRLGTSDRDFAIRLTCSELFARFTRIPRNHVNAPNTRSHFSALTIPCASFMSSVDLHTHSGFQRMLPESFAVVCAPKSNPKCAVPLFLRSP